MIYDNKFSFIISTYNRCSFLKKTICSILDQGYQNIEIIITDDASTDNTKAVVDEFNDSRIMYLCNKTNSGLSITRNAGMKMAHGDYFIIMDDDAILQNNFLKILNNIVSNTKINALCPKILDPDTKESFAEFSLNTGRKNLGYFDFNYFRGGIHILNKEIVMKNGYFDERFGIGGKYQAAEESDYFFRLKQLNEDIMYFPDLIAYHPIEKNPCSSKVFSYSYAISAMLTKQIISDLPHFYYYFIIILRRLCVSLLRSLQYSFFPKSIEEKNKIYKYKYFFQGSLKGIFDYLIFR